MGDATVSRKNNCSCYLTDIILYSERVVVDFQLFLLCDLEMDPTSLNIHITGFKNLGKETKNSYKIKAYF